MSNRGGTYVNLGASNHCDHDRAEKDYYSTDPKATELLMKREVFCHNIAEPCVGGGAIADVLVRYGYEIIGSDIVNRGYPNTKIINFIDPTDEQMNDWRELFKGKDIITNPPYSILHEFLETALENLEEGHKLAIFVRIQALEGKRRRKIFEKYPIHTIYVPSARQKCHYNGKENDSGSAMCFCWFVWVKGWKGDTVVKWLD